MKKIIRLTENDLARIVRRVISENSIIQRSFEYHHSDGGDKLNSMGAQGGTWKRLKDNAINIYYVDKSNKKQFFKTLEFEKEDNPEFDRLVKINQVGNWALTGRNNISLSY